MNKEIALQISKEYQMLQDNTKRELKRKRDEIYKKLPEIKNIDEELSRTSLAFIKNIYIHSNDAKKYVIELKNKIDFLRDKKLKILQANGYPANYLEETYRCKDCHDTGYVHGQKCHCYKRRIVELCYEKSNLKDVLKTQNFDNFNLGYYSESIDKSQGLSPRKNIENILAKSKRFIENFDNITESFLFYGRSGLGKTFLSHCIAKELLDKGYVVLYLTSSDMFDLLRTYKISDDDYTDEHIQLILNSDLLILDDLGTEALTAFTQQELFNVINKRLLRNKKMLISTNLSFDEIMDIYPERIYSRLLGNFQHFYFFGDDIRLKKKLIING